MIKDPKHILKEYCKKNEKRYTPEREIIIEEIYRNKSHFDVDQLFLRIRNRYPKLKLAKGSIYRTVPILIDAGLIRESLIDNGRVCYEHILGRNHHDHLKCLHCGKIFEFYDDEIDKKQEELCRKRKFNIVSHLHVIWGYCLDCAKKKVSKNAK